ncbi:cilia- and flagella-associated protein 161-like [Oncorhynchus nerka]|uniref:cilia- and flagella-associated protein 161-like n=1 Tax=Oncorhynchus nerka TaxID=8023 RepID=UPI0031B87C25
MTTGLMTCTGLRRGHMPDDVGIGLTCGIGLTTCGTGLMQDTLKDFLDRKERGELMVQKTGFLKQNILKQVSLSVSVGGAVCFGDVVMLVNVCGDNSCSVSIYADLTNLGEGPSPAIQAPCGVSGGRSLQPCTRNAFIISSVDGSAEGEPLRYNQSFALRTTSGFAGGLYLTSDHKTFQKVIAIFFH